MENETHNKMILQSYQLTTIRDDFGIYAQRLIVRIAEAMQYRLLDADFLNKELKPFDTRLVWKFKLADLQEPNERHNARVKQELQKVIKASVYFEHERGWHESIIFTDIDFDNNGEITVEINHNVWNLFVEISKGFKKYQLDTAMKLKSTYALRLYQLLNGNATPITYTIDWLRQMFGLKDKYKNTPMFLKRVIDPAMEELKEKAETSFSYKANKEKLEGKGRPQIVSLTFFVEKNTKNNNAVLKDKEIMRKYGIKIVPKELIYKLAQSYDFKEQEIKNNASLYIRAEKEMKNPSIYEFLDIIRAKALKAKNPKGYVVKCIKNELDKDN